MASEGYGTSLELQNLWKTYGDHVAVRDVSLAVLPGEFLTLLGPSGSGKTTTLGMIAGFSDPSRGKIMLGSDDISGIPSHRRNIGVVFQGYLLFPHLTVFKNVAYPLARRGVPRAERRARAMEALELVHLQRFADRYPAQLSGGEQQRVALARAIVFRPPVLLMDEPMGALDKHLRESLQWELKRIQQETRITCVYVTHDQEEALILSDRIAVFEEGSVRQVGSAPDLYERPASLFVAKFVGESNIFAGPVEHRGNPAVVQRDRVLIKVSVPDVVPSTATHASVVVRPERMRVVPSGHGSGDNRISGLVKSVVYLGPVRRVEVAVAGHRDVIIRQPSHASAPIPAGEPVDVLWDAADGWLVPDVGEPMLVPPTVRTESAAR